MKLICFCVLAITVSGVYCDETFEDASHPVRSIKTSRGVNNFERVDRLVAKIYPFHHLNADRVDFPKTVEINTRFDAMKVAGDERGHLVASQFSGPPKWYNLSPQSMRVNRNAGFQSVTSDWYSAECEVADYLAENKNRNFEVQGDSKRHVDWTVDMIYEGNAIRPKEYRLQVDFWDGNQKTQPGIVATISNKAQAASDTQWICRKCRRDHEYEPCKEKKK